MTYFVFAWTNFGNFGGIQVLIDSLTVEISKTNQTTAFVGIQPKVANLRHPQLYVNFFDKKHLKKFTGEIVDRHRNEDVVIFAFNGASLAISVLIKKALSDEGVPCKILMGIYHPSVFRIHPRSFLTSFLANALARGISENSIYFMNCECKRRHLRYLGKKFEKSAIILLPVVDLGNRWNRHSTKDQIDIVSVGRISKLKGYNFSASKISQSLANEGLKISWKIFGRGEDEAKLKDTLAGQEIVEFLGPISNDRFFELAGSADLFVGMGTAAVQASQLGIPTILAVEESELLSYGFSFEAPAGNVGELEHEAPKRKILDVIQQYQNLSPCMRSEVSKRSREWSLQFSFDSFKTSIDKQLEMGQDSIGLTTYIIAQFYAKGLLIKATLRSLIKSTYGKTSKPNE